MPVVIWWILGVPRAPLESEVAGGICVFLDSRRARGNPQNRKIPIEIAAFCVIQKDIGIVESPRASSKFVRSFLDIPTIFWSDFSDALHVFGKTCICRELKNDVSDENVKIS